MAPAPHEPLWPSAWGHRCVRLWWSRRSPARRAALVLGMWRAVPDGYTIGIGNWGSNVANGALYTLPYDFF